MRKNVTMSYRTIESCNARERADAKERLKTSLSVRCAIRMVRVIIMISMPRTTDANRDRATLSRAYRHRPSVR